tara:strand:+ start:68 stop:928 length:861 start_codon:yes stop_codon:yes gene_type:complete
MTHLKNFWFSYSNILLNEIYKKNILKLLKKTIGIPYKFFLRYLRHNFSKKIINLDNIDKLNFSKCSLDKLFVHFNCDKGSSYIANDKKISTHNYSIFYEKYLSNLKEKKINILEIGSHEGKGIASFYFYFPYSKIIGANINPFQMKFKSKRITELFINVSSKKIIKNFSDHIKVDQDIIIDDASHNLRDILFTLSILFKKLKSGGLYILEDMNQFHVFPELNPFKNELTPKQIFNRIKEKKIFKSSFISDEEKNYLIENIKEIKIETGAMKINNANVSDIAFIFKR